jgi:hypothetical protein
LNILTDFLHLTTTMSHTYQPRTVDPHAIVTNLSVVQRWEDESGSIIVPSSPHDFGPINFPHGWRSGHTKSVTCDVPHGLQQPQYPNNLHLCQRRGQVTILHSYSKDKDGNIYYAAHHHVHPTATQHHIPIGCHFCKDCGQMTPTPGGDRRFFGVKGRPDMCVCTTNQTVEDLVATLTWALSNAQQQLEQQKIITDKAAIAAKDAEDGRAKAIMVLEEAKVTETETAAALVALQREVDDLISSARREDEDEDKDEEDEEDDEDKDEEDDEDKDEEDDEDKDEEDEEDEEPGNQMVSPGKIAGFDRPMPGNEDEWVEWADAMLKNDEEEEDPCINEMGVHCCCVCCTTGCCRCDRYQ